MTSTPWKTAWVTGASTGIGCELSLLLARNGTKVAISARSKDKLHELAARHANLLAVPLDVTDLDAVRQAHARIEADLGPVDLAVLNAGKWDQFAAGDLDAERMRSALDVNYGGIVNALDPLIKSMRRRGRGHIALTGSVAGYRGLPQAAAYGPTKAAIINLAEIMRLELSRHGITVSVVNPGFVDTPMTRTNDFSMPFLIAADDAARRIVKGLEAQKFEVAFPWQLVLQLKLLRLLPYAIFFPVVSRLVRDTREARDTSETEPG